VQHNKNGQLISGKINSEELLNINLINSMPYKHFTPEQRNELSALLQAGLKKKDIAHQLQKHRTNIWRELKRNSSSKGKKKYNARKAKQATRNRRITANARFRKLEHNRWLRRYVVRKIKKHWSPEQIAGRLKRRYCLDKSRHIGKDSIYEFIYTKRKDLVNYLRCQKGKYRRRYGTRIREKQREELKKRRIDTRPEIVATKQRIGDWEGDTVVGKDRKPAILTHVERTSGLLLADKLERATKEATNQRTIARFRKIPKNKKHTLTYDNGAEFWEYELTEKETGITIYFAYPYHSWERGANENANGLLRQFFPKKSLFRDITQEQIQKAVRLLNSRPRKRHNYLTPYEVFNQKEKRCALE
jgi:transposase, IS30 family